MAIKFKLSDEEKKKINKIATAMEEEKQATRETEVSQDLPTAKLSRLSERNNSYSSRTKYPYTNKYGKGNIDLTNRPIVKNDDGSISTVRSMSFQDEEGKEVLVPTVVNGKIVSDSEAINNYYRTGEYLGKFDSVEEANEYAEELHKQQEKLYSQNSRESLKLPYDLPMANQATANMSDATPAELAKNNAPIVSSKDSRLALARKKAWEYNTDDYKNLTELNQVAQQKQADAINEIAEDHPIKAGLLNTGLNLAGGMLQSVGGFIDASKTIEATMAKGTGAVAGFLGNKDIEEKSKKAYEKAVAEGGYTNSSFNTIASGNQGVENGAIKTIGSVASTMGRQLMDALLGEATGTSGSTLQGIGVAGSSSQEVLAENPDNIAQAVITGTAKGIVAKKLEDLFDANILTIRGSKSSVQNQVTNWISNTFRSKVGKEIANRVTGVAGENIEEFLEDNIDNIIDKLVNNKDLPSFEEWWNNTKETAKVTTISTIAMNLLGLGGESFAEKEAKLDSETNFWINEAQKVINGDGYITQEQQTINQANNNTNVEQNLPTVNTENTYSNQLKQMASKEITNSNISEDYKTMMLDVLNSMNEVSDADISSIRQNINSLEDANNNKEKIRSILKRNGTFSEQIDKYVENKLPSGDFLYLGETPTILKKIGLNNEEMVLKQGKLKSIIKESSDGTDQMHGLPIETIKKIPEAIANPLNVLQSSSNKDSIVVITDLADTNERPIIASIEVNYNGQIGNIDFLSNRLTSAYGKNNYDRFMKTEIAKGNLLYDIDEGIIKELPTTRLQLPKGISSSVDTNNNISTINNSISQNNNSVKNTTTNNYMQKKQNNSNELGEWTKQKKDINPSEISSLSKEDSSTTPKINPKKYEKGNRQSNFYENVVKDSQFINKDFREEMSKDENIRYYKGITNEQTLQKAYESLKDGGKEETLSWFSKNEKNVKAEDVAKGWILLKQYQDAGDYQGAVEVAKKMRQMGTNAGQAVQAYNILSRLTPEGMFYYAQSELNEAYSKMVEGKSKQWIEANQDKFNLTQEETQTILDTMKEVASLEDGREKNIKLAQIQKLVSDKIPPTTGQSVKAWMRISMLFNPKTQVRNVMGNAVVLPVNATSDVFAGALDKLISKKTGVRTTGVTKEGVKGYAKGFKKGVFESYDDFRKGINTRNVEGNRFEIGEGKSFKDKGIGKTLNRVDNMLSFALDVGDRGFYEATYTNSINNQMILNNTTKITQDMIDIATNEALQRTWQDSNNYTQAVLSIRKILNKVNVKGYGLGDVLIPFAKTPANLTKAIVDYSPVGLTKTLAFDAKRFTNSLQNGQYSPQLQHDFVQNVGKGLAGTMLYTLGYALAKAGIATGEPDDDKDVKNFMKNSLGISSYSIKIGDKSFTYDWAQPVATPLAIMTNYVKYSKDNPDASAIDKAIKAMNIGTEQLLQQSFMESLNTVLNGNGTTLENLSQAVLELPARAVPTFCKQIADMVDGTQRSSFEYGQPIKSAINSVKAKIPGLSQTLPASVDTLGNDIQKYGGNNNLWNVMLNPANTNKGQLTKTGQEIYNVYMNTGDSTIFPRTAPYYINNKGEKITMSSEQRNKFQRVSGKYVEESLDSLLNNKDYKNLNNNEKASIINEIVSDSYSKAKYDVLEIDSKEYLKTREILKNVSPSTYYNYKIITKGLKKDNDKIDKLVNSNYSNNEKTVLYETYILSDSDTKYPIIKNTFTENGLNISKYLQYKLQKFTSDKKDDGTVNGKSITGSKKDKVFDYIDSIKGATYTQKLILYALEYKPSSSSDREIVENYVRNLPNKTAKEKLEIMSKFAGVTVYKNNSYTY